MNDTDFELTLGKKKKNKIRHYINCCECHAYLGSLYHNEVLLNVLNKGSKIICSDCEDEEDKKAPRIVTDGETIKISQNRGVLNES